MFYTGSAWGDISRTLGNLYGGGLPQIVLTAGVAGLGVSTWKYMQASLYGTASHVEAGAELIYSKQNAENYLQAIGTVILSV